MTRHWKVGSPADEQLKVIVRQLPDLLAPHLPMDRIRYIFDHVPIFQQYSFEVFKKRVRMAIDEYRILLKDPMTLNMGPVPVLGINAAVGAASPSSKRSRVESFDDITAGNSVNSSIAGPKNEEVAQSVVVHNATSVNVTSENTVQVELSNFPVQTDIRVENNRTKFVALVQPLEHTTKFVCNAFKSEIVIAMEWPVRFANASLAEQSSYPARQSPTDVGKVSSSDANSGISSSSENNAEGTQPVNGEASLPQFRMRFSLPWEVDVTSLSMSRKVLNDSSILIVECFSLPTPVEIARADSLEALS